MVILVVLMASGCASAYREGSADEALAEAAPTEAELDDQLTRDQLSEAQLSAFEIRAQQKLQDFIDYLNMVGDPSLDSAFRTEAARQAEALLASPPAEREVRKNRPSSAALRVASLPEFMRTAVGPLAITALTIRQPLELDGSAQYRGKLSFKTLLTGSGEEGTGHEADVVVRKVEKSFGDEIKVVWEVFLGEIR